MRLSPGRRAKPPAGPWVIGPTSRCPDDCGGPLAAVGSPEGGGRDAGCGAGSCRKRRGGQRLDSIPIGTIAVGSVQPAAMPRAPPGTSPGATAARWGGARGIASLSFGGGGVHHGTSLDLVGGGARGSG